MSTASAVLRQTRHIHSTTQFKVLMSTASCAGYHPAHDAGSGKGSRTFPSRVLGRRCRRNMFRDKGVVGDFCISPLIGHRSDRCAFHLSCLNEKKPTSKKSFWVGFSAYWGAGRYRVQYQGSARFKTEAGGYRRSSRYGCCRQGCPLPGGGRVRYLAPSSTTPVMTTSMRFLPLNSFLAKSFRSSMVMLLSTSS